jgi:hypothetical protein
MKVIVASVFAVGLVACNFVPHKQCAGALVHVGSLESAVLTACGKPMRINTDDDGDGPDEQWVYSSFDDYVYIKNGVVTAVQYQGNVK